MLMLRLGWMPLSASGTQLQQLYIHILCKSSLGAKQFYAFRFSFFVLGNFCVAGTFAITCGPLRTLPAEATSAFSNLGLPLF